LSREEALYEIEDVNDGTPSPRAPEAEDEEPDTERAQSVSRSVTRVTRSVSKGLRQATKSAAKSIKGTTSKRVQAMSKQSSAIDEEDEQGETPLFFVFLTNPTGSSRRCSNGCRLCRSRALPSARKMTEVRYQYFLLNDPTTSIKERFKRVQVLSKQSCAIDEKNDQGETPLLWVVMRSFSSPSPSPSPSHVHQGVYETDADHVRAELCF
jgi:hypothetical protein